MTLGPPEIDRLGITAPLFSDSFYVSRNGRRRFIKYRDMQVTSNVPGGRLSLHPTQPIMPTDVTDGTTIYYIPYTAGIVPLSDGQRTFPYPHGILSLDLDSNSGHTQYHQSGKIFDVFLFKTDAGVITIGTGPAWSSLSARGSGAGTTQIGRLGPVYVNSVAIQLRTGSAAGDLVTVPVFQASCIGSFYCTADGATSMEMTKVEASGGSNARLAVFNIYNQVRTVAQSIDSTASWTYATATYRPSNNNANNAISWLDGLLESYAQFEAIQRVGSTGGAFIGISIDSTTVNVATEGGSYVADPGCTVVSRYNTARIGWHTANMLEKGGADGVFYGSTHMGLFASVDM